MSVKVKRRLIAAAVVVGVLLAGFAVVCNYLGGSVELGFRGIVGYAQLNSQHRFVKISDNPLQYITKAEDYDTVFDALCTEVIGPNEIENSPYADDDRFYYGMCVIDGQKYTWGTSHFTKQGRIITFY